MLDVLLVSPYALKQDPLEQKLMKPYPTLGLLYIAAALRQDYRVEIFDSTFRDQPEAELAQVLRQRKPRIVGVYANVVCREQAGNAIRLAKSVGCTVIAGGPDPSTYEDLFLGEYGADFLVLGEGEITIRELTAALLNGTPVDNISGLAYLKDGAVFRTAPRAMVKDLDTLPIPAWDMVNLEQYFRAWRKKYGYTCLHIMTSRGCPFSCNWCSKEIFARSFRQHSPQRVVDEMLLLRDHYGVDQLWLADDIVGANKKWMAKWHAEVMARNARIPFECLTRVDLVNEENLRQLKDIGVWKIYYGAESGSQRILDAMHKETKLQEIYDATKLTKSLGIQVGLFIMFGYPGEELEDVHATEKMLADLQPETAGFSVAYPLKGTPFYEKVKEQMSPQQHHWESTNQNKLLFKARFPNRFYNLTIRIQQKKMANARRKPLDPARLPDSAKIVLYRVARQAVLWRSERKRTQQAGQIIPLAQKNN